MINGDILFPYLGMSFFVLGSICFLNGMKFRFLGMNGCKASGTLHADTDKL